MSSERAMTHEERLAVFRGDDLESYRKTRAIRAHIYEEAQKYYDLPASMWPKISMKWDLSKGSQRHSLDCTEQESFDIYHPEGFLLGFVDLQKFDKILCHYSRRDEDELWEVGSKSSLAFLIVYLSEGRPISPPLVNPHDDYENEVILNGGHHRYAIAKAIGEKTLPIYTEPENKEKMDMLLTIRWD